MIRPLSVLCALALASPELARAAELPRVTLSQALALALEHNPRLAQARAELTGRAAAVHSARLAFDTAFTASLDVALQRQPVAELFDGGARDVSFGGSVAYQHRFAPGTTVGVSLAHRFADSAGTLAVLSPRFTTELRASATQPLLRGFGSDINLAGVGSASTREAASRKDYAWAAQELVALVAQAYWAAAQAAEEVEIRRRAFERAEQVTTFTQELIKRGALPQAAMAQAISTRALRKARLQSAQRILEQSVADLMRAMLDRAPGRVAIADRLPAPPAAPAPLIPSSRDDVNAAELRVAAASADVPIFEDRVRPSLDLSLFAGLSGLGGTKDAMLCASLGMGAACADGDFDGYGKAWSGLFAGGFYTAGVSAALALPVIDEGARGRADEARAVVKQLEAIADSLRRQMLADVTSLAELVATDRVAYQTADEARAAAAQLIEVEDQRYKIGSSTTFDVLRVQDDLAEAESFASTARAAVMVTDVRYQLATGRVFEHLGLKPELP